MKCEQCGREITELPHLCPALSPEPPLEFVDVFLTRLTRLDAIPALQAYLQKLLPHLDPPAIACLMQHLPAVILRSQPRVQAEALHRQLTELGAQIQLKTISPARPATRKNTLPMVKPEAPPTASRFMHMIFLLTLGGLLIGLANLYLPGWLDHRFTKPGSDPLAFAPTAPLLTPMAPAAPAPTPGQSVSPEAPQPAEIQSLLEHGVKQYKTQQYVAAIHTMEQALALDPKNLHALNNLAVIYCTLGWQAWEKKNPDNARDLFEEALQYNPAESCAIQGMGYTYYQMADLDKALQWLNRYFDLGGEQADAYALIAEIYYQQNNLKKSLEFLRMALALAPSQTLWQERLRKRERELKVEKDFLAGDTRHFVVKYEGYERAEAGFWVMTLLEEAYLRVGAELHYYPPNPITAILYTDRQFEDVTRLPTWTSASYDGKIRLPAKGLLQNDQRLRQIVFHEYTHAAVHEWSRGHAPTWIHEGLAQTLSGEAPGSPAIIFQFIGDPGRLIPLSQLEGPFVRLPQAQAQIAYAESLLAVQFLEQKYNAYAIHDLIEALADDKNMDQAIRQVTYLSYDQFNQNFFNWADDSSGN